MSDPVIYLLRHGTSEWNLLKKWQGEVNTNLAPVGIEQAKTRATSFKATGIKFDAAFTSDLRRASHTCELLMSTCGEIEAKIIHEKRLRECGLGEFEGMEKKDIYGPNYSELWAHLDSLSHEKRIRTPYFQGLETPLDVGTRAIQCLRDALHERDISTSLAMTHSTVIESILAVGFGAVFDSIETENLCWIRFREVDSRLVIDASEGVRFQLSPDAVMPSFRDKSFSMDQIVILLVLLMVLSFIAYPRVVMQLSEDDDVGGLESVNFCEANYIISHFIAEFFNSTTALLLVFSGWYSARQFHNDTIVPSLFRWLSLCTLGLGCSLVYTHSTLKGTHQSISSALALVLALGALLSLKKDSVTFNDFVFLGAVFAIVFSIHNNSDSSLFLTFVFGLLLVVYLLAAIPLCRSLDPRISAAMKHGLTGLTLGSISIACDSLFCFTANRLITIRAIGYCLTSLSISPLFMATCVEHTSFGLWLQPSTILGYSFPNLGFMTREKELAQK